MKDMVLLNFNLWSNYTVGAGWEADYIREGLADAKRLGVTHILVSGSREPMLMLKEIEDAGLRAVLHTAPVRYKQGEMTGSKAWRLPSYIEGLKAIQAEGIIDAVYADDVTDDGKGDPLSLRRRVKAIWPEVKFIVSPTNNAALTYAATLREPRPGAILYQCYPHRPADTETGKRKTSAEVRADTMKIIKAAVAAEESKKTPCSLWVQCFGYTGSEDPVPKRIDRNTGTRAYHVMPPAEEIAWTIAQVRAAGLTGGIGLFTAIWWSPAGDLWSGLYHHDRLVHTHDYTQSRKVPQWQAVQTALAGEVKDDHD